MLTSVISGPRCKLNACDIYPSLIISGLICQIGTKSKMSIKKKKRKKEKSPAVFLLCRCMLEKQATRLETCTDGFTPTIATHTFFPPYHPCLPFLSISLPLSLISPSLPSGLVPTSHSALSLSPCLILSLSFLFTLSPTPLNRLSVSFCFQSPFLFSPDSPFLTAGCSVQHHCRLASSYNHRS